MCAGRRTPADEPPPRTNLTGHRASPRPYRRADGSYSRTFTRLAKVDVLVLDDLLIAPLGDSERRDLLEIVEDRYDGSSTIVTSQLPTRKWHEALGDPTVADTICDRLVPNAYVLNLKGPSIRKQRGTRNNKPQPTNRATTSSLRSVPTCAGITAHMFSESAPRCVVIGCSAPTDDGASGFGTGTDPGSGTSGTSGASGTRGPGSGAPTGGSGTDSDGTTTTGGGGGTSSDTTGTRFDVDGPGESEGGECEVLSFVAKTEKPEIMLVLDKSGSMVATWLFNNVTTSRWAALYMTVDTVLAEFEDRADFGAELFPFRTSTIFDECAADDPVTVPVAPLNRAAILGGIPALGAAVDGLTPMGSGVELALEHLAAIKNTKPQAIVLVTDGGADPTCEGPNTLPEIETMLSAAAAEELYTYVVGIDPSDSNYLNQLNALAVAGGQPLAGPEPFYNAQDGDALLMKIGEIVEGILSCEITLDPPPNFPDLATVDIDGTEWPQVANCDTEDGWIYSNPFDQITLCGTACQELRTAGQLNVRYQCPEG